MTYNSKLCVDSWCMCPCGRFQTADESITNETMRANVQEEEEGAVFVFAHFSFICLLISVGKAIIFCLAHYPKLVHVCFAMF